jgi:DNA helicase-2/ATP-dependent DNA helicase PcrA
VNPENESLAPHPVDLLADLNPAQREAVLHGGGPLLVLAGAGSGKTRAITHRIAHLILERGVRPWRIVAVTFTNKAAAEMRSRVEALLGGELDGAWIGTFHGMCLRILRRDGRHIGLAPGFNVYDRDDQLAIVKRALKDELGDNSPMPPRTILARISRAKNAMKGPEELARAAHTPDRKLVARVFERYAAELERSNAVDFDDLLLRSLALFRDVPEVAESYASRCEHLLVDEYQDTNRPQYLLARALTAVHGNICVVGDEDQSIYRFRGAELRNILDFSNDHSGTVTIRLEQNYRSTATILQAAGSLVANNTQRLGKSLWTSNARGERIELYHAPDDRDEAAWVVGRVRRLESSVPFEGMAVLYRTNAQSRQLEEAFRTERIPFQVVGSVQFYARKEIKDLMAYLRLAANPRDDVSFRRVMNTPARGIGGASLAALEQLAADHGLTLLEAAARALDGHLVAGRPAGGLRSLLALMGELASRIETDTVPALLERILQGTRYEAHLEQVYGALATERMENVRALISAAVEYAEENDPATLQGFLDRTALVADADEVGARPGVTLMTVHNAKGLEFPVVFIVGLEEELFPHAMSGGAEDDLEEERRLCYVAMTRARERLLLAHAEFRRLRGALLSSRPSRFLEEVPAELIRHVMPELRASASAWSRPSYGATGSSAARVAAPPRAPAAAPVPPAGPAIREVPPDGFAVGAFVRHPRFGAGRILDREGSGKNLKLTIHFADHGAKKILPAYTQMKVQAG